MESVQFYKALADETRLKAILLINQQQELCVCELVTALQQSQPKISRHLAQLKKSGLLVDRKQAQWVFYALNPALPSWQQQVIAETLNASNSFLSQESNRLNTMGDRPERQRVCC